MNFLPFLASSTSFYAHHEEKNFLEWMKNKNNIFVGEEYHFRLGIFLSNKRKIDEHNRNQNKQFKLGINPLVHLTSSEYNILLSTKFNGFQSKQEPTTHNDVAPVDYRELGYVNPIKDQLQCGSCWAFSIIAAAETNNALRTEKLYLFSEQNLVDCVTCSFGCSGGIIDMSIKYLMENQQGKLMKEEDYLLQLM